MSRVKLRLLLHTMQMPRGFKNHFATRGLWLSLLVNVPQAHAADDPLDDVDPFIGTTAAGEMHPAARVPFGFVWVGPDMAAQHASAARKL